MSSRVPEKILRLARAVADAGGRALLVGGCVRDRLLGREVKDWDVEVYGVEPALLRELLARFGRVNVVGEAFTVYKLGQDLDVSLPRRERKTGRGHRAFYIEGDPSMSSDDAARRRDFTVNAILEDPLTDEIIDPFGGLADIERKILRAVSPETFVEDSLRVLRAAQFAARFRFDVEPSTVQLCRTIDLTDLPAERVWGELEKILLAAPEPSAGLRWLDELGATPQLFPEIAALKGVPQEYEWHPEGWVLEPLALPPQPLVTGMAETVGINLRPSLWEVIAGTSAGTTMIPASGCAAAAQSEAGSALHDLPAADGAGPDDLKSPPTAAPAILTQSESLVWSFGTAAPDASEVVRVVFKIPLNRMRSVVRRAVNDFEIVRGIVHPVAVFVVDVLPTLKAAAENQLHYDSVDGSGAVPPLPTGVHVTSVVVDARAAAVDGDVLIDFNLSVVRDREFAHSSTSELKSRGFLAGIGDVSYHTQLTVDRARELVEDLDYPRRVTLMLAALCHDFGKPSTTEFVEGRIRSRGHDEAGTGPTLAFLERLKMFTLDGYDVRAQVVALVRDHLKPGEFYRTREEITDGAFRRLARRCELELLYRVAKADSLGRNAPWVPPEKWFDAAPQEWFIARARELSVERKPPEPILLGRHLLEMGLKPSPLVGEIQRAVYELQLDNQVRTLEEARAAARELLENTRELMENS